MESLGGPNRGRPQVRTSPGDVDGAVEKTVALESCCSRQLLDGGDAGEGQNKSGCWGVGAVWKTVALVGVDAADGNGTYGGGIADDEGRGTGENLIVVVKMIRIIKKGTQWSKK